MSETEPGLRISPSRVGNLAGLYDFSAADAAGADAKRLMGAIDDSAHAAQVGVPTTLGEVVRVTDPVSELGGFSANVARLSHSCASRIAR